MIAAFTNIEQKLMGWPDTALTLLLILGALIVILIALMGSPLQKATALAYIVFP